MVLSLPALSQNDIVAKALFNLNQSLGLNKIFIQVELFLVYLTFQTLYKMKFIGWKKIVDPS